MIVEVSVAQQPRQDMVKESLLRNLVIAKRLGLLTPANLEALRRGKSPVVNVGPYAGEVAEVDHILPLPSSLNMRKNFGTWN